MDAVKKGNKLTYYNMGMLCFGERQPGIMTEKEGTSLTQADLNYCLKILSPLM